MPCEEIAKTLGLKLGIVTTGNSLDCTEKDLEIIRSYNGVVKDMEAAAIAWIAKQYNIPFLAIKAITDLVDGEKTTEEEFLQNLESASKILSKQTIRVLELLSES
jgi:nucleoside phosphorylase